MGCTNPEKELYIIPKDFKGTVFIVFNVKDGTPKKYLNGYRLYEIPSDGVLFTQFGSNTGESPIDNIQYKYIRDNDTLSIKEHLLTKDTTSASPQIFLVRTGMFGDKERYEYISFIVANYAEWQSSKDVQKFIKDDPTLNDIIQQRLKNTR